MSVIFVGPSKDDKTKISGGKRRFKEAVDSFLNHELNVVVKSRPSFIESFFNKDKLYVTFDERYLMRLVLFLIFNRDVIFFPRGNKVIHYKFHHGPIRLFLYRLLFSFLYARCKVLIFQTKAQQLEFSEIYNYSGRYKILPNNINASWMLDLIEKKKRKPYQVCSFGNLKVGFLGGLDERKGFRFLYRSLSKFINEGSIKLSVAGEGKCSFSGYNVIALGKIFDDELVEFYTTNDIVMIPSRYDSFPNVLLEALACGSIPLVARTPITEDILGSHSYLLFDLNEEGVERKLYDCMHNPSFVSKLQEECEFLFEKYYFDWSERVRNIIFSEVAF